MSQDSFTEFVGKLNTDEALRTAMTERFGNLSEDIPSDALIAFAGERGYTFNVDEAEEGLSEDALEGVAGGAGDLFAKVEYLSTTSTNFEQIKVTYSPIKSSFNFFKV